MVKWKSSYGFQRSKVQVSFVAVCRNFHGQTLVGASIFDEFGFRKKAEKQTRIPLVPTSCPVRKKALECHLYCLFCVADTVAECQVLCAMAEGMNNTETP